ncbi:hypothetical protein ACLMJK_003047 [Lecanora helva]
MCTTVARHQLWSEEGYGSFTAPPYIAFNHNVSKKPYTIAKSFNKLENALPTADIKPVALSTVTNTQNSDKCPISNPQFDSIRANHSTLASTGCTKEFCQAGRAVHTDEPRVGENRALSDVEKEAQDFLHDLHKEGFFDTEDAFRERRAQVLSEIRAGATEGKLRHHHSTSTVGGSWIQTSQELEYGLRRAWRNSRKCIMRSHCEELELCDLRNIRTSKEMAETLLLGIHKAFNRGSIQPTVFVFPPRAVNCRGPVILNHQILQFAGYEATDGSIIGDPSSVEVTKAIIELGWEPPKIRGRWDLLPLVTMAEGDKPYIAGLPADISKLVDIRHPQYTAEFERLDLKWVAFPALARLGFDIGGVQYTAAPFIGWFMDAEIGVRDLADTFRYNVLPDVVDALGLMKGGLSDEVEEFEDLPEYEKLALLSRAQAELNYAVHWSYLQAKVMMTDSLTASMKWCRYDDDFQKKNGFRLPADPYWLAPPQGSIIPLWHRGGAPNYQPKPMISKHVQDPIKAWRRERDRGYPASIPFKDLSQEVKSASILPEVRDSSLARAPLKKTTIISQLPDIQLYAETPARSGAVTKELVCPQNHSKKSIAIYYCSSGNVAEKLAGKLHKWTQKLVRNSSFISLAPSIEPLNSLKDLDSTPNNVNLLVVSSTGQGEVPENGLAFTTLCEQLLSTPPSYFSQRFDFAIFGNGDSRYSSTFNGAATRIHDLMRRLGGIPLAGGPYQGDTAVDPLPLRALKAWFTKLEPSLTTIADRQVQSPAADMVIKNRSASKVIVSVVPVDDAAQAYEDHHQQLISTLKDGTLLSTSPELNNEDPRSVLINLSISDQSFPEMSCIQLQPINAPAKVQRALSALGVEEHAKLDLPFDGESPTFKTFLTEFIDLELPFPTLDWLDSVLPTANKQDLNKDSLRNLSVPSVLERLHHHQISLPTTQKICLSMPLLRPRTYSLASSTTYTSRFHQNKTPKPTTTTTTTNPSKQKISIIAKRIPTGRFSSIYLTSSPLPSRLKYRIVDSISGPQLRSHHLSPCIIVATGAGFGPVRAFLQWRIASAVAAGATLPPLKRGVSLFVGMKECDLPLLTDVVNEALALDLIDVVDVVVSNGGKRRVQDGLGRYGGLVRRKLVGGGGMMFVCANKGAAEGVREVCEGVLGVEGMREVGERYVEEVF